MTQNLKTLINRLNLLLEDEDLDESKLLDASEGLLPSLAMELNKMLRSDPEFEEEAPIFG
jgi:hypothetical protein